MTWKGEIKMKVDAVVLEWRPNNAETSGTRDDW